MKKGSWIIVGVIVVAIIIVVAVIYGFSQKDFPFKAYKLECSNEDSYFENLSLQQYNDTSLAHVLSLKVESDFCDQKEIREIVKDDLSDLGCRCVEWNCSRQCVAGFHLANSTCYSDVGKKFTQALIPCSRFACDNDYVDTDCQLDKDIKI